MFLKCYKFSQAGVVASLFINRKLFKKGLLGLSSIKESPGGLCFHSKIKGRRPAYLKKGRNWVKWSSGGRGF